MRNVWAVCKRELVSFFVTPVGYVILCGYAAMSGFGFAYFFILFCRITVQPSKYGYEGIPDLEELMLSPFLIYCAQLLLFIAPLITMRLLSEERNRGTIELLLTYPLRDRDIIFGKFLASMGIVLMLVGVIAVDLAIVGYYTDVQPAVLVFGLVTFVLVSAAILSMGLFISSVTSNQITAGVSTFAVLLLFYILGENAQNLPEELVPFERWPRALMDAVQLLYTVVRQLAIELPIDAHAKDMAQGVVRPEDVAYYILFTSFFLFLTFRALESRRWRA